MKYQVCYNLPFICIHLRHGNARLEIPNILIDTGSATSILSADMLDATGISPEPADRLRKVSGIGGCEVVYERTIDFISIDSCEISECLVQIGSMNYGFEINGILGMDFLKQSKAGIDIEAEEIYFR